MKNILLFAHDDAGQEARLQCALDLTRAMNGHLTCVDVTQQPAFLRDYVSTAGGMLAFVDEDDRETRNTARLRDRLGHEGVSWDVIRTGGDAPECLVGQAALADVIVVSTRLPNDEHPDMVDLASEAAVNTRCLIMAVPHAMPGLALSQPALIAWDGSGPAIAAMRASLPLLKLVPRVTLFAVDEDDSGPVAEEAATYLSRHGIKAVVELARTDGIFAPDLYIRERCEKLKVSFCVMGAYGRSRRIENIFGGVTRRMLAKSSFPLLLAH